MRQVLAVVVGELERLAREGFAAADVAAAMNTVEFALREQSTGIAKGVALMLGYADSWRRLRGARRCKTHSSK